MTLLKHKKHHLYYILIYILSLIYLFPIIIAVLNSFKSKAQILTSPLALPDAFNLENYKIVISKSNFGLAFLNSLIITIASIILIIVVSSTAGYALARWKSRSAQIVVLIFMSAMFVPFHTIMISLLKTTKSFNLTGNILGLILIYGGLNCPIPIFLYRGFVRSIPIELEEAGVIDGCNIFNLFFRIVLPLLKPISGTVAIINALWIWNDFLLPYLVLAKPLTIPLSQMYFYGKYNQQWHLIMAGFVISTLPIVTFFLIMQKSVYKSMISGVIKG